MTTHDTLAFVSVAFDRKWPGDDLFVLQDAKDNIIPGTTFSGSELTEAGKSLHAVMGDLDVWFHQEATLANRAADEMFDWVEARYGVHIERVRRPFSAGVRVQHFPLLISNIGNDVASYRQPASHLYGATGDLSLTAPPGLRAVAFTFTADGKMPETISADTARSQVMYLRTAPQAVDAPSSF